MRAVSALVCAAALVGCSAPAGVAAQPAELWSAHHETGDASEWFERQSGAIFNTGTGSVTWTDVVAHQGSGALALSVSDVAGVAQAARIFRWAENPVEATFRCWYYFPDRVEPDRWWNILQFKSDTPSGSQPTWTVNVGNAADGSMRLYLYDAITGTTHHDAIAQPQPALETGRWSEIAVYVLRAGGPSGRLMLWQDGVLLYDLGGIQTAIGDNIQWSVNSYSDNLDPPNVTFYIDDAAIMAGPPTQAP
jgi:hypothetical protein